MSAQWWNWGQAPQYLLANRPCESPVEARSLLIETILDGTIASKYDGLLISKEKWKRMDNNYINDIELEGLDIDYSMVSYSSADIERLCNRSIPAKPGGRPLKDWETFLIEVIAIVNKDPDGLPKTQATFEKRMLMWAEQNMEDPPKETAVRNMISAIYQRVRP